MFLHAHGPYRQSERLHLYESYAKELLNADAAYYCFCSAAQLEVERQEAEGLVNLAELLTLLKLRAERAGQATAGRG